MDAAGHYLILGRSDIGLAPDINDQVYLLALDASGAVLASEIFGGNADSTDAGRNIVVSGNDLFISGSFWNLSTQRDLFVRRCANSLGINGIADKNNHITLFPNPAQHEISIACSETYDKFEISNILGQIVLSGLMPQNRKIWLNGIPNGPYTLQLSGSAVKPANASLIISK
jgi:hypothetical protein